MAGGRFANACLGPYETAEIWDNTSGGAATITINAATTDGVNCNNLSLNLSNQTITPQDSVTVECTANVDDWSLFRYPITESNGSFGGYLYQQRNAQGYGLVLSYKSGSAGSVVCDSNTYGFNTKDPIPHPSTIPPNRCNHTLMPVASTQCQGLYNLNNIATVGTGSNTENCFWQDAICLASCYSATGACSANASRIGTGNGELMSQSSYGQYGFGQDYWSDSKKGYWSGASACIKWHFLNEDVQCNPTCCCCCCKMCSSEIPCCCTTVCKYINYQFCDRCTTTLNGSVGYWDSMVKAGCGIVLFQDPACKRAGFYCSCSVGRDVQSLCCNYSPGAYLNWEGSTDNRTPVRWMVWNHKDNLTYFAWYNAGTPNWNGIYTISDAQRAQMGSNGESCSTCIANCYSSGDGFSLFTKLEDLPSWMSSISSQNLHNSNPVAVNNNEWVVYAGDASKCLGGAMTRYTSTDLINWEASSSDGFGIEINESAAYVLGSTCNIDFVTSCFSALCNNGLIEQFTPNVSYERTGVVLSNGDKVYARNKSNYPVAINIWGFTE